MRQCAFESRSGPLPVRMFNEASVHAYKAMMNRRSVLGDESGT